MTKLLKHVSVRQGFDTVWLAPGDDLPDWAVGLVGDHALAHEVPEDVEADSHGGEDPSDPSKAKPKATPAKPKTATELDFTSAAPRRGRPRK